MHGPNTQQKNPSKDCFIKMLFTLYNKSKMKFFGFNGNRESTHRMASDVISPAAAAPENKEYNDKMRRLCENTVKNMFFFLHLEC